MSPNSTLTGRDNYFEDFEVGAVYKHARGKTITNLENVLITNLVMNTAQGHFNEHAMKTSPWKGRFGAPLVLLDSAARRRAG